MAEISNSPPKMALWPNLKRKVGEAKQRKKQKQKKTNPFASQGLEKFAMLMSELQAKKSSLVDKTGNSVSAVRYLSRSAQEWTASTIARTASRRKETSSSPKPSSSEILLLQHSQSKETTSEVEVVDFSQSFSFADLGHRFDFDVVGDLQREVDSDADTVDVKRDSVVSEEPSEEVGCSGATQTSGKSARLIRDGRLLLLEKGWARSPNSAVALLVALSACVIARVTKLGNSFLELLNVDLFCRWQKGKFLADFVQSLVTRHIVPHFSISVPQGLALLPLITRTKPTLELEPSPQQSGIEPPPQQSGIEPPPPQQSEIEEPDPSFRFPVVPESLSLKLPASPQLRIETLEPVKSPNSTRRLVRKLSSKLKAKMSRSPTPGSPDSSHSHSSCSSPRRSSKFSFSKEKEVSSSDDGWPDDDVFAGTASSSKRRCILKKKCSFRKEKTPEISNITRKSPLGRNFSMEATTSSTEIPASLLESRTSSSSSVRANFDLWLILGLLVALLFLLVSRLSAIVATSLFFLLLSNAYKDISKFRVPPRWDMARALPRSHSRFDSPSREEPA